MATNRFYRDWVESDLIGFEAKVDQTDLFILADKNLEEQTKSAIVKYREAITDYIKLCPEFEKSLKPLKFDENASEITKKMLLASNKAGVGPMAAIAGALGVQLEKPGHYIIGDSKEELDSNKILRTLRIRNVVLILCILLMLPVFLMISHYLVPF